MQTNFIANKKKDELQKYLQNKFVTYLSFSTNATSSSK